jgi:Fe-S-cluster containining protein
MPDSRESVELGELVDALLAEPRYSTGDLSPMRSVSAEESLTVLEDIYAGTDASDEHLPALAKQMGREIACHKGCPGKCCESLVLISEPEGLRIANELKKPERREVRERFLARVIDWAEKTGDRARRAADSLAAGDVRGYVRLMREHGLSHSMCPFNTDDSCDIHDVRPLPCRQAWVLDTWKNCRASTDPSAPDASLLTSRPHEDLYERAKRVLAGLQNAMGRGTRVDPLPSVVWRWMNEKDTSDENDG